MQYNKKTLTTLLAATLLSTTLSASDVEGILELKYGIADGKATSYVNTASDTTSAMHLSFGAEQKKLQHKNTHKLQTSKMGRCRCRSHEPWC